MPLYKSVIFRMVIILVVATVLAVYNPTVIAKDVALKSGIEQNTLIELYTSQGCSSCPPAELWLGKLQEDSRLWEQLIPIAFHVDYWDYIGWKDQYAKPEYSQRQQRYQNERGIKTVYTPSFIVNGKEWRSWFGLRKLPVADQAVGELAVRLQEDKLIASFQSVSQQQRPLLLNIAILAVGVTENVTRGENAGKTLAQDFVVLRHEKQASQNGRWMFNLSSPTHPGAKRMALVAWVNRSGVLKPIQAVGGWIE